jgi:4-amino-4-deoxy-L-arabinose transferase-like glycosyltransferase
MHPKHGVDSIWLDFCESFQRAWGVQPSDKKENRGKHPAKSEKPHPALTTSLSRRFDRFWLLLILLPPLLLFPRLGQPYLWQDEAETALLGRATLEHGYPLAVSGKQVISDQPGQADVNPAGVWVWSPWLQDYVAALSFAVFGVTTWAARLPFALLGWAVLILNYAILKDVTRNRRLSRYAALLLVASVPFLLYARQCRYYTLLTLFTMLHVWGYVRLTRKARGSAWLLIAGGIGLYHSFFPQLLASTMAMAVHGLLFHRNRAFLFRFALYSGVIGAVSLPFFIYTKAWSRNYEGAGYGFDDLWRYLASLRAYLLQVHVYCWPALLALPLAWKQRPRKGAPRRAKGSTTVIILALLWLAAASAPPSAFSLATLGITVVVAGVYLAHRLSAKPQGKAAPRPLREEFVLLALLLSVSVVFFAGICNYPFFRYLIGMLPLFAVATAATVIAVGSSYRWGPAALAACLILCDVVYFGPFLVTAGLAKATRIVSADQFTTDFGHTPSNLSSYLTLRMWQPFPKLRSFPWEYAYELTHDYLGPIGGVILYLREHARAGEVFVTSYEHFPLMFYTDLKVYSTRSDANLSILPDWVLIHGGAPAFSERLVRALQNPEEYRRVSVMAHELPFENTPEPNWHQFRTWTDGPLVVLFHRARQDH